MYLVCFWFAVCVLGMGFDEGEVGEVYGFVFDCGGSGVWFIYKVVGLSGKR